MKKFALKIVTLLLSVCLLTGTLASCGLFVTNTDRDMAQRVATVKVSDKVNEETIYKRDMIAGYYSYGYNYVQQYSYTLKQTYELILNNLINNFVVTQAAQEYLAGKNATSSIGGVDLANDEYFGKGKPYYKYLAVMASSADVAAFESANAKVKAGSDEYYDKLADFVYEKYAGKTLDAKDAPFRFVSSTTAVNAVFTAIKNVNALVESFANDDSSSGDTHEHEKVTYDVRTTPTIDSDEDDEETLDTVQTIKSGVNEADAFNKGINRLKKLGLVDGGENPVLAKEMSVLTVPYFKNTVTDTIKSALVQKYQDKMEEQVALKDSELYASYVNLKNNQNERLDGDLSTLETKLGEVSKDTFVLYSKDLGYAYVSHILIGYSDEQKARIEKEITGKDNTTNADILAAVNAEAEKVIAKDQRESWVKSGYGLYSSEDNSFTFDSKYVYGTKFKKFGGTVGAPGFHVEEEDDNGDKEIKFTYNSVVADTLNYTGFCKLADKAFGLTEGTFRIGYSGTIADYDAVKGDVEDLKYAYSTDTGNLGKYLGYLYSPYTSESSYVQAFAAAAKEVASQGKGAYKMFASKEYGLHIVVCTEKASDYGQYADEASFVADLANAESFAARYKKASDDMVKTTYISKLATSLTTKYSNDGNIVKRYEKAYADLMKG